MVQAKKKKKKKSQPKLGKSPLQIQKAKLKKQCEENS